MSMAEVTSLLRAHGPLTVVQMAKLSGSNQKTLAQNVYKLRLKGEIEVRDRIPGNKRGSYYTVWGLRE